MYWLTVMQETPKHLQACNRELQMTLEKLFVCENLKFLMKEFQFVLSLKNWLSMAYTVGSVLEPMTLHICYHSN